MPEQKADSHEKVDDLVRRDVPQDEASKVKGGAPVEAPVRLPGLNPINPRGIIPCV